MSKYVEEVLSEYTSDVAAAPNRPLPHIGLQFRIIAEAIDEYTLRCRMGDLDNEYDLQLLAYRDDTVARLVRLASLGEIDGADKDEFEALHDAIRGAINTHVLRDNLQENLQYRIDQIQKEEDKLRTSRQRLEAMLDTEKELEEEAKW